VTDNMSIPESDVEAVLERFNAIKNQTGFANFVISVFGSAKSITGGF